jgi:hypothetical protein
MVLFTSLLLYDKRSPQNLLDTIVAHSTKHCCRTGPDPNLPSFVIPEPDPETDQDRRIRTSIIKEYHIRIRIRIEKRNTVLIKA